MSTNAEKNKRYSIDDIVKIAVSVMIAIGGGQVINTASAPNERVAVVETEMKTIKTAMPVILEKLEKISKTQDSLLIIARIQR